MKVSKNTTEIVECANGIEVTIHRGGDNEEITDISCGKLERIPVGLIAQLMEVITSRRGFGARISACADHGPYNNWVDGASIWECPICVPPKPKAPPAADATPGVAVTTTAKTEEIPP